MAMTIVKFVEKIAPQAGVPLTNTGDLVSRVSTSSTSGSFITFGEGRAMSPATRYTL